MHCKVAAIAAKRLADMQALLMLTAKNIGCTTSAAEVRPVNIARVRVHTNTQRQVQDVHLVEHIIALFGLLFQKNYLGCTVAA